MRFEFSWETACVCSRFMLKKCSPSRAINDATHRQIKFHTKRAHEHAKRLPGGVHLRQQGASACMSSQCGNGNFCPHSCLHRKSASKRRSRLNERRMYASNWKCSLLFRHNTVRHDADRRFGELSSCAQRCMSFISRKINDCAVAVGT